MEMAEYQHLRALGMVQPGATFAGHSLGEYAALGACTSIMSLEDLLDLVFYRGLRMHNAITRDANGRTDYAMMAVDPSRVNQGRPNSSCKRKPSFRLMVSRVRRSGASDGHPVHLRRNSALVRSRQLQRCFSAICLRWPCMSMQQPTTKVGLCS